MVHAFCHFRFSPCICSHQKLFTVFVIHCFEHLDHVDLSVRYTDSISCAEPALFWVAPAPDGQGPRADSGSDLIGSTPAPGKKKAALGPYTKIFILSFQKVNY